MNRDQQIPVWIRFVKFGLVGGSGVLVNLGIYFLLTRAFDVQDSLTGRGIAYGLSVEVSIITNFLLNDVWTFSDRRSAASWRERFLRFHLVSAVGFGINWGVFALLNWFLVEGRLELFGEIAMGPHRENLDDLAAACLGIGAAMFWNFFGNLLWTWKGKQGKTGASG